MSGDGNPKFNFNRYSVIETIPGNAFSVPPSPLPNIPEPVERVSRGLVSLFCFLNHIFILKNIDDHDLYYYFLFIDLPPMVLGVA